MRKKSASSNKVLWAVQLEEEKLTWLERTKLAATARLPEIDLVNVGKLT